MSLLYIGVRAQMSSTRIRLGRINDNNYLHRACMSYGANCYLRPRDIQIGDIRRMWQCIYI